MSPISLQSELTMALYSDAHISQSNQQRSHHASDGLQLEIRNRRKKMRGQPTFLLCHWYHRLPEAQAAGPNPLRRSSRAAERGTTSHILNITPTSCATRRRRIFVQTSLHSRGRPPADAKTRKSYGWLLWERMHEGTTGETSGRRPLEVSCF